MPKVLLIDDDPDFVEAVKIFLESNGYQILTAYSRTAGKEVFEAEQPDLVVLDVMMDQPDDGFVLAQYLKATKPETPILILTSVGQVTGLDFDKDEEMVPVDAFEQKPIMPNELLARVKELLSK
jgi:DNA-binding response OmpR family regulator